MLWILYSINRDVLSYTSGAPAGTTNASGETTCATNTFCHNATPNAGSGGTVLVPMEDLSAGYVPGTTYTIMPYVNQTGSAKIGFQTVALLSSGQGAGSVTITNTKTQLNTNDGKEYVTHTASGTTGIALMDWMYEWTAPAAGSGIVTIYGAFIASNNNGSASGDSIYTDSLVISEKTMGMLESFIDRDIMVYPVPFSDYFSVFVSGRNIPERILIYDISGRVIYNENWVTGEISRVFKLGNIPHGIYYVSACYTNHQIVKKVVKCL